MHGKEGATGLMPPVGGALDDEQIASVLTYVRREWGHTADPVDASCGDGRASAHPPGAPGRGPTPSSGIANP